MSHQAMGLRIDDKMGAVLDVLAEHGYATTGMLVDRSGYSRPTVSKRLDRLFAADHVRYVHESTALWQLVDDPREDDVQDETDDVDELIDALVAARERQDPDAINDALDELCENYGDHDE